MNTQKKSYIMNMAFLILIALSFLMLFTSWPCIADTSLTFATVNSPPLCSETLPNGGVYTEITRIAFERAGYTIDVEFVPWKRALEKTKWGGYNGLMLVSYKESRLEHLHYTNPVINEEGVLFSKKGGITTYTSLKDLAPYTIGTMTGSMLSDLLIANNLKVEEVTSHEQNIKKLMLGRIDLIAGQKLFIHSIFNAHFPESKDSLKVVVPPLHVGSLHNVISLKTTNHEAIVLDFNKGLKAIQADGTFEKILQKHGLDE